MIKEAIMSLQLKPGQAISEIELAEALKISRTPIREVLAKLREENLVEVIPQVGTYVSKIKPQLLEEAAFMRVTLEKEVLKQSCKSFPQENLIELKKNVALQEILLEQHGTAMEFQQLDTKFHCIIYQGNHHENIWRAIIRLSTHHNRMKLLSKMEQNFQDDIDQHKKMIKMIENKEVEQVESAVYQHSVDRMESWKSFYKEDSPYVSYFDLTDKPVFF